MVGATIGEAGLPMAIGFLLESFGPRSLPWTILMCALVQVVIYCVLHFLGSQGSAHESQGNGLMDGDTEDYYKISLDIEDDADESGVEMVDI